MTGQKAWFSQRHRRLSDERAKKRAGRKGEKGTYDTSVLRGRLHYRLILDFYLDVGDRARFDG